MSINKLRPLPPFKLQVLTNFPFIDADFDALTNWELYAKLVDYLNKVIVPSENEVISAFNDLKDYVDNFLDNLNIQEEVNNKLDEMALDGTLENLLTPIVNGILTDEKLSQIVYNIWGEDWNNLATKSYVDEKVAKYGIMPSASVDYLGKIVQYIGVTDSIYTRGYFYECVDNGDDTYSWSEINFSGNTPTDIYYMDDDVVIDYNNGQYASINKLIPIINEVRSANKTSFIINVRANYGSQVRGILVANIIHNTSDDTYTLSIYPRTNNNYGSYKYISNSLLFNSISSNLTLVNNEVTALSNFVESYSSDLGFLPVNNTESYNVTSDYNPAHKKYVDDNVLKFDTMPTATSDYLGKVVQFIGTTDSTYTKGHFYECVSDGALTPTYSWSEIEFGSDNLIYELNSPYYISFKFGQTSGDSQVASALLNIVQDMDSKNKLNALLFVNTNNVGTTTDTGFTRTLITLEIAPKVYSSDDERFLLTPVVMPSNHDAYLSYLGVSPALYNYQQLSYIITRDSVTNEITSLTGKSFSYLKTDGYLLSSNTIPYSVSSDYIPAHKKYVDDNILKFSTMPTASNDYLGKVVQFIGTTDSTYTKGHFYECVYDGVSTYSWSEISFGGGGGANFPQGVYFLSSNATINFSSKSTSNAFVNELLDIVKEMKTKSIYDVIIMSKDNSNYYIPLNLRVLNFNDFGDVEVSMFVNSMNADKIAYTYTGALMATWYIRVSNNEITGFNNNNPGWGGTDGYFIKPTNTKSWNVTSNYNPTHKLYVDTLPTTYSGYDATKTQTLKNVNGTLTWVDDV